MELTVATYNVENLGIRPGEHTPESEARIPKHVEHLREALKRNQADVLCLQEIINPHLLDQVIEGLDYPHKAVSVPPKNPLCSAVLSRYPIVSHRELVTESRLEARDIDGDFFASVSATFSRPAFEVEINLGHERLFVYNVHWKSKIPSPLSSGAGQTWPWANFHEVALGRLVSEITRMAQAAELRKAIDQKLSAEPEALLLLAGDFNDVLDSEAIRMTIGDSRAARSNKLADFELWPCESAVPDDKRYTMIYRGRPQMLDHLFVSHRLKRALARAHIDHEGLKAVGDGPRADLQPGSDHAPFLVTFKL